MAEALRSNVGPGKQNLQVVVWEWKNKQGRWRPYSPEVTQQLERAHVKNLRSVFLEDADPNLKGYCVILSSLVQQCVNDNSSNKVRRNLYPHQSPAGQGAVWQWKGNDANEWLTYDMNVQCILEDTWASGAQSVDMSLFYKFCPYIIDFCHLTQKNKDSGCLRQIRRLKQAAYPIGRPPTPQDQADYPLQNIPLMPSPSKYRYHHRPYLERKRKDDWEREHNSKGESSGTRSIINKVLNFAGSSSIHHKHSSDSSQLHTSNSYHGKNSVLSLSKPPVPKPRTMFPLQNSDKGDASSKGSSGGFNMSYNSPRLSAPDTLFGAHSIINNDCEINYARIRRPSNETISTYLSSESVNEENIPQNKRTNQFSNSECGMSNLMGFDDSLSEDEVFSEDQEVMEVLMSNENDNNANAISPHSASLNPHSHFVPISTPSNSMLNGVKKKYPLENGIQSDAAPQCNSNGRSVCAPVRLRKPNSQEDNLLIKHCKPVTNCKDESCAICLCDLVEQSDFGNRKGCLLSNVVSLNKCSHMLHEECLLQSLAASPTASISGFVQCPICKTLHGEKWGTQPKKGSMDVTTYRASLPGHHGCGTIQITYKMHGGIQGPEHPHPGRRFSAVGFPRVAYLPVNEKGRKVLRLMREAFKRRLIFTIGTSVTTGCADTVTWNEIHHKTERNNGFGHGYPDPAYLDNVLKELELHGVTDVS